MRHTPTPINVRLRGDQTKGRLAVMEHRVAAGFEPYFARLAAERQGIDPPDWALRPLPEVRTVGPPIGS